jgi:hypothetical protein
MQGSAIYFYGGPDNLKKIFGGPEKTDVIISIMYLFL